MPFTLPNSIPPQDTTSLATQGNFDAVTSALSTSVDLLDINVRAYAPGIDFTGSTDTTTAINAMSLAASTLAAQRGQRVRLWGFAGAKLLVDGIRSYENLRWEMEDAQVTKTSGVNPLFYTTLTTSPRTFTTTLATGRTVVSTNTIHDVEVSRPTGSNVDRPGTLAVGGSISGAGIQAAATITAIRPANREIDISSSATASASLVAISHNPSFGTLSSGTPTVNAISHPRAWVVGRTVTGTNIPALTTVQSIDWTNPAAPVVTLSANASGSGATNIAVAGSTFFGRGRNITLVGGTFDPNGIAMNGAIIYPKYTENFRMENVTRLHNWGTANPTWALDVLGYDATFLNNRVVGGTDIFMDGNHITGGEHMSFVGEYVESGDDAFALCNVAGSTFALVDPRPIANITGAANIGRSAKGFLFRPSVEPDSVGAVGFWGPNFAISDINFEVNGSSGKYRNGGIWVSDDMAVAGNHADASNRLLSNIKVRTNLDVGSTYHDGTNPYGVYVRGANDVQIDATVNVVGEGAAPFERYRVREADRVSINLRGTGGTATPLLRETRRLNITEGATSTRRQKPRFEEDFIGTPNTGVTSLTSALTTGAPIISLAIAALPVGLANGTAVTVNSGTQSQVWVLSALANASDTTLTVTSQTPNFAFQIGSQVIPAHAAALPPPWQVRLGSNPGNSAVLLPDSLGGLLRLVPGVGGTSLMTTDGVQADTPALSWRALDGGLALEARVRLTQLNGCALFIGFANQRAALQLPGVISGSSPVTNQSTMVGVVYDATGTGTHWWGVGSAASVVTGQDFGVVPTTGVGATFVTWRIEVDASGTALFELDGSPIGTRLPSALVPATAMTPYVGILGRATGLARGALDVDYVTVERLRG